MKNLLNRESEEVSCLNFGWGKLDRPPLGG